MPISLVAVAIALVVALTSGGAHTTRRPAAGSAIGLRTTGLGKVLVDAKGRTLYLFEADTAKASNCTSGCRSIWPPFTANAIPHAMSGALAGKLGAIAAAGAKRQVTYNGHPLYYYIGDHKPGDTSGQGLNQFGAEWYVVAANGAKIDRG